MATLDCGHPESEHSDITTGYATCVDGRRICYECAADSDRAHMIGTGRIVAYLSGDGRTVSTWPGVPLMRVTSETVARTASFGYKTTRTYLRAVAPDGTRWHGTSPGRGMFCRMRRNAK